MNITRFLSLLALVASASITLAQVIPNQYIAVFKDDVRNHPAIAQGMAAQHGLAVAAVYQHALKGFAFSGSPQAAEALARRLEIAYIEPDQVYHAWAQIIPTGVDRVDVDETGIIDGYNDALDVDIAIIDTGIDASHPDLRVVDGRRFYVQGIRIREDGNYNDDHGHGTHVAGTAGAIDNGLGVVGVAPGARLWAVKVLDRNGSGSVSGIIAGMDWVTARASTIEVANMSLGGGYSQAINDAVQRGTDAGIVYVVAAGNENTDAVTRSPASAPSAITVSALADSDGKPGGVGSATSYGADDTLATFSNWGPAVDICAPGVAILSTLPGNRYGVYSGTSMASPHVAGAAALYMAGQSPRPSVEEVTVALRVSGWQAGEDEYFKDDKDGIAEPLLNVGRLMGTVEPPPVNNSPAVEITSPTNGATFNSGDTIPFTGEALDTEDGVLTSSLVWVSSLDGSIGVGGSLSAPLSDGTHTITASVTDTYGATGSATITVTVESPLPPPPPLSITLTATGYKVKGRQMADLNWAGATSTAVDVYRNDAKIATVSNTGSYTDNINSVGGGSYTYRVCEADGSNCSNDATVNF